MKKYRLKPGTTLHAQGEEGIKVHEGGDIVTLNESQAYAFRDRIEPLDKPEPILPPPGTEVDEDEPEEEDEDEGEEGDEDEGEEGEIPEGSDEESPIVRRRREKAEKKAQKEAAKAARKAERDAAKK